MKFESDNEILKQFYEIAIESIKRYTNSQYEKIIVELIGDLADFNYKMGYIRGCREMADYIAKMEEKSPSSKSAKLN